MRGLALLVALGWALPAAAQPPVERPVDPDSPYIRELLYRPMAEDLEDMLTDAAILRLAGESGRAAALESIAEKRLLGSLAGLVVAPPPYTLEEALVNESAHPRDLAAWRRVARERSVKYVPRPAGSDARTHAFRNETPLPITKLRTAVVSGSLRWHCSYEGGGQPLAPGAVAEMRCSWEQGQSMPADVHGAIAGQAAFLQPSLVGFEPGGFSLGTGRGTFGDYSEAARRKLASASESVRSPVPLASSGPTPEQKRNRKVAVFSTAGAFFGGLVLVLIGGFFPVRPSSMFKLFAAIAGTAAVIAWLWTVHQFFSGFEFEWKQLLVQPLVWPYILARFVFGGLLPLWLWLWFAAGMFLGVLVVSNLKPGTDPNLRRVRPRSN